MRIRYATLLALLMLLAYQFAILFWNLYPVATVADTGMQSQAAVIKPAVTRQVSYLDQAQVIKQAFLFGKAEVNIPAPVKVEQAPETELKYKLRGIYFSDIRERSSAIVEVKANDSKLYRVDDELADNIVVAAIEKTHILINRYGKLERLNLEKPIIAAGQTGAVNTINTATTALENSALLRNYRQRYEKNPMALAQRFQSIPVQENGKHIGFKLKALGGERLLKQLDFQDSDVFIKVNGIGLDQPFQALEALKSLTTAQTVSVTILRNGREQTLDFSL